MKKSITLGGAPTGKLQAQGLTIGLDLGDRSSWYCVLNEQGEVVLEQKVATTPNAMRERQKCQGVGSHWKPEPILRG